LNVNRCKNIAKYPASDQRRMMPKHKPTRASRRHVNGYYGDDEGFLSVVVATGAGRISESALGVKGASPARVNFAPRNCIVGDTCCPPHQN
jgi:hypothetical protein